MHIDQAPGCGGDLTSVRLKERAGPGTRSRHQGGVKVIVPKFINRETCAFCSRPLLFKADVM